MKKEIEILFKNGMFSGYRANKKYMFGGEFIQKLEKEWAKYFKVKHAIAVNSATSGIYCALAAYLGNAEKQCFLGENEIIVAPYSMTCSATLPLIFGTKPIFCDIENEYFCLDSAKIESLITKKTKGIIVVDLFGMPYEADIINDIAKKHNLFVIEDAAQAIGSIYKGKFAGTLGDIGIYSLNQHKHLSAGEGGIVVTNNDILAERIRLVLNHGEAINNEINNADYNNIVGMNFRMTEITAIIALEQLKNIDKLLLPFYDGAKDFDIKIRPGCKSTYYKYATYNNINPDPQKYEFKQGYIKPLYQMPIFRNLGYKQNLCPVCEKIESKIYIANIKY